MYKSNEFKAAIEEDDFDKAIKMLHDPSWIGHCEKVETLVFTVFENDNSPIELIDAILEAFLASHREGNGYLQHETWTHSLSHFTSHLWERRLIEWIVKLNKIAFEGAQRFKDNCSERLIHDFIKHAKYNDRPEEFHITKDNIKFFMTPSPLVLAYIENFPFEIQIESEIFKLQTKLTLGTDYFFDSLYKFLQEEFDIATAELEKLGAPIENPLETKIRLFKDKIDSLQEWIRTNPTTSLKYKEKREKDLEKLQQELHNLLGEQL